MCVVLIAHTVRFERVLKFMVEMGNNDLASRAIMTLLLPRPPLMVEALGG